ncbi:MAG: phospholipid/cholesterol/gamma-HCH transport system substrate-binding protein, partial [Thermoleophilaceae bacterium]|nr:phospholipid/cholesterol/gamma-HCH transport system substrate-binding protein [Thermoleophilaceae bacterium]
MSARGPGKRSFPRRFVEGARNFADPPLKVGRIPFGRTVLILQLIAALTFLTYTLIKKNVQVPFFTSPYLVDVIIPDAQGLNPAKEPAAGVAGVPSGKVAAVHVEQGQAHVTVRLDSELRGKIFNDATVFVRPTSILQTLIVNIIPGNPATGPLDPGRPILPQNTTPFVAIDDLTGLLDSDTQTQLQVLIDQAATALDGREPELRQILAKVAHLADVTTPVARSLAERRQLLTQLTDDLDVLFTTLGRRGEQL